MQRDPAPPSDDVLADDPRASLPARTQTLIGIAALGWAFYSVRALITGHHVFSGLTAVAALLTLGVYLAQRARPDWARPLGHATAAIATLFILLSCLITQQVLSASLPYLVCVPLAAGYLQGIRTAAVWAAICAAAAVVNELIQRAVVLEPHYVNSSLDYTTATVVLIVTTVGLVTGSERVHAAHLEALKRREETIRSLNQVLQKKSEEAEQARDRAIAASRAKGEFVATLSHEIRTPLNGVLGMAGLLLDDELPPQQRELVRTIRTSGDALLGLLNDMLDFSKIEAGRLDLERAPFDVRGCIEDTFDLLGVTAANKRLRLAYVVQPGAVTQLLGDAGRVRQILVNLVGNAVKFTDRGEIVVEVASAPAGEGACELQLAVRDTGIGIPKERLGSLFEPFTQADASTTTRFGGTGLGLAICRRLAEAMGGRVSVDSRPGEGATFHVTVKLDAAPASRGAKGVELADRRVLVASPHEATRRMIAAQLGALGAIAIACSTEDEVARELGAGRVDALIAEEACAPSEGGAPHEARLLLPWEDPPSFGAVLRAPARSRDLARLLAGFFHAATPSQPNSVRTSPHEAAAAPSVLVAEDNPVNQRVVRLMLERLGCRPDVAGNGVEALDALRARSYDLVLMDVRMPDMDGIAATRVLRGELPAERQPLVVAMTANVQVEDQKACEEAGMDDFVPKPIRPADLARVVKRARKRAATRA